MKKRYIAIFNKYYFSQGIEDVAIFEESEKKTKYFNSLCLTNIKTKKNFIFFFDQLYYYLIEYNEDIYEVLKNSKDTYRKFGKVLKNLDLIEELKKNWKM